MTLAGSTLGIDPTAIVHVAGVSADGGITASSVHSTGLLSGDNGINLSAGDITVANGARFTSGVNGTIRVASGEVQLLPGNDTSKGLLLGTTIHTHKKITVFEEGISMDAAGITFADGTYQDTAASASSSTTQKYSMGFFYDGRGSDLSTGYISDIIRYVEQGATATKVTVYYPTAVTATAGVELYKVGTTYFNSPGASFEANGTLIAGVSVDSGDYGASAGIAVALNEDDIIFGRLTNSGHTDKLQIFLKYESSS
jgi:hypothetical protein